MQEAHVTLHQALQQAVVDGLLVRNVCEAVTPPKAPRSEARSLTPAEVERLLAAAPVLLLLTYRPGYSPSLGERTYSSRLALSHLPAGQECGAGRGRPAAGAPARTSKRALRAGARRGRTHQGRLSLPTRPLNGPHSHTEL